VIRPMRERRLHLREPPSQTPGPGELAALDETAIENVRRRLMDLMSPVPVEIDELVRQTGAGPALVQAALLELELAGRVVRLGAQRVVGSPFE